MSDFDHKNIPTLDDIIDVEENEAAEFETNENTDSLDLFATDDADSDDTVDEVLSEAEDSVAEASFTDDDITQFNIRHSYEDIYSGLIYPFLHSADNEDSNESKTKLPLDTITLEKIVGNVVKQILPDIEQQLRFLIHRSLEEKLPEEIDKFTNDNTNL